MASLSLYPQFETNLMSNREVVKLLLQLKSEKAHDKNYIKVKPHLVRHLLRNRLFASAHRSVLLSPAFSQISVYLENKFSLAFYRRRYYRPSEPPGVRSLHN